MTGMRRVSWVIRAARGTRVPRMTRVTWVTRVT